MLKLTKALVASTIIAGAVFAAPVAANAAPYTPPTTPVVSGTNGSSTVAPGGTFSIGFGAGTFTPSSPISVTVTLPGSATIQNLTIGTFVAAPTTANGTSNSAGGATVRGTIPTGVVGTVPVTATDLATGRTISTVLTIAAVPGNAGLAAVNPSGLAHTGTYISLATIWGAVGLVAVGGGFIAIRTMSRRKQAEAGAHTA